MYNTVTINDYKDIDIEFDDDNIRRIKAQFKHVLDNRNLKHINKLLDLLKNEEITVEGYIRDCEVDEDEIVEAYNRINNEDGTYEDGYNDAKDEIKENQRRMKFSSKVLWKLEKIAYNFGNQEEITREDCREILHLLGDD